MGGGGNMEGTEDEATDRITCHELVEDLCPNVN